MGLRQFDILRQQASQRSQGDAQKAQDALKRRFSALGASNSGAAIKAEQNVGQEALKQREAAIGNIDVAEAGEMQRQKEVQEGRDFQITEAQKQRDFASGEAKVGREFEAGQADLGRRFQRELFDKESVFKNKVFDFESGMKAKEFDLALREFDRDSQITAFNQALAMSEAPDRGAFYESLHQLGLGRMLPQNAAQYNYRLKQYGYGG